jgi:hypothetical protein
VLQLSEILAAHPEQHRAVELGIAADKVVLARLKFVAFAAQPVLGIVVPALDKDLLGISILLLAVQITAAFQDQDPLTRGGQPVGEGAPACAAADDNHVVLVLLYHDRPPPPVLRSGDGPKIDS